MVKNGMENIFEYDKNKLIFQGVYFNGKLVQK